MFLAQPRVCVCLLKMEPDKPRMFHLASPASIPSLDAPPLLHLVHPIAVEYLNLVLMHVRQLRAYLGSLSASSENSHMARDVLTDLVDSSGVDIAALEPFLAESVQISQMLDSEHISTLLCC
jgi:hypothetical protein